MAPKATLNPPTFRYPFEAEIAGLPMGVQNAHRAAFQGVQDLQQAVTALNTKVGTSTSSTPSSTTIVENSYAQTVIAASTVIGTVNNQTGVTTYTTQQSDYGAFIIFNDSSPVAVTLATLGSSPAIALPWYTSMINSGTGTVTLTPSSGLIEGGATFQLHANNAITIVYDGTNFYVEAPGAQPQNTPAVAHEWLNSFNSTTGTFGQSQPSATDLTNGTTGTGAVVLAASPTLTGTTTAGYISVMDRLYLSVGNTVNNGWAWEGFNTGIVTDTGNDFLFYANAVLSQEITQTGVTVYNGLFLSSVTTATTATSGGASALPTDPAGYLEVGINGTTYKIPYYNV